MRNLSTEKQIGLLVLISIVFSIFVFFHYREDGFSQNMLQYPGVHSPFTTVGEITQQVKISQSFKAEKDYITGIQVQFATYMRENNSHISIRIFQDEELLYFKLISAEQLQDNSYETITFDPIKVNKDASFRVEFASDDAVPGNAVTLWKGEGGGDGLRVNGQRVSGGINLRVQQKGLAFFKIAIIVAVFALVFMLYLPIIHKRDTWHSFAIVLYGLALLGIGMVLLFFRNADPLFFPILYGEDGYGTELIIQKGVYYVAFLARPDFAVLGIAILLKASLGISKILFGYDLSFLPIIQAIIAYFFVSFSAVCGYFIFRSKSYFLAIIAYVAIIFMPLGIDGNEVIGRILNLGFIFPVLSVFCLLERFKETTYTIKVGLIDFFNIISCLTLPVGFGLIAVYLVLEYQVRMKEICAKRMVAFLGVPAMTFVFFLFGLGGFLQSKGGTTGLAVASEGIIEFFLGRSVLFPFVSGYWQNLNDGLVLFFFSIYFFVVMTALYFVYKYRCEKWYVFLASSTFIYWLGLVFPRMGFTSLFNHYTSSSPDRYFYGLNVLCVLLLFSAVRILGKQYKQKWITPFVLIVLIFSLGQTAFLFEYDQPVRVWREYGTFQQAAQEAMKNERTLGDSIITVHSYPEGWNIRLPIQYVQATAEHYGN